MRPPEPRDAAPLGEGARRRDHAVPLFEGRQSRRHVRRSLRRLRAEALWLSLRRRPALGEVQSFVQFAGWPRSGHSLIGALIDAHPQAAIAHELDAMGLFHKGVAARRLPALCLANAAAFTRAGRHWNGFCYAVPGAAHGPVPGLRLVGDKKGDWATRWAAADPDLVERLAHVMPLACRWILVTRHPADNIATMSLRRGGGYDRLRIGGERQIGAAIRDLQKAGRIATEISDAMIADYRALAASVAEMKRRVPPKNWIELSYEGFARDPKMGLARLAEALDLAPDPAWCAAAARIVGAPAGQSRDRLAWRAGQRAAIAQTIAAHDFLSVYADDA